MNSINFTTTASSTNINNIITTLGGTIGTYSSTTGIYVNIVNLQTSDLSTFGNGGFDTSYDSILYWNNSSVNSADNV